MKRFFILLFCCSSLMLSGCGMFTKWHGDVLTNTIKQDDNIKNVSVVLSKKDKALFATIMSNSNQNSIDSWFGSQLDTSMQLFAKNINAPYQVTDFNSKLPMKYYDIDLEKLDTQKFSTDFIFYLCWGAVRNEYQFSGHTSLNLGAYLIRRTTKEIVWSAKSTSGTDDRSASEHQALAARAVKVMLDRLFLWQNGNLSPYVQAVDEHYAKSFKVRTPGKGLLYVVSTWVGSGFYTATINNTWTFPLNSGEHLAFEMTPGKYDVKVNPGDTKQLVNIEPGKVVFLKLDHQKAGDVSAKILSADEGASKYLETHSTLFPDAE
jgi:hypothetical protein